jgi:hypothetical protein
MFLDSFPLHEPEARTTRPARETSVETVKSRSAWPFIVAGNDFGVARVARDSLEGLRPVPASASQVTGASSFVT